MSWQACMQMLPLGSRVLATRLACRQVAKEALACGRACMVDLRSKCAHACPQNTSEAFFIQYGTGAVLGSVIYETLTLAQPPIRVQSQGMGLVLDTTAAFYSASCDGLFVRCPSSQYTYARSLVLVLCGIVPSKACRCLQRRGTRAAQM